LPLFEKPEDYEAFERVLAESYEREKLPIFAYCAMPNHWHFLVRPRTKHQVTSFFRWLTNTHTMRWHAHHHTEGSGHLYQGRFKAFPIQEDEHLLSVLRYVERNPLRANLCQRAEDWRWSSLWRRKHADRVESHFLPAWPIERPRQWVSHVNKPQTGAELEAIRHSIKRRTPFGSEQWVSRSAVRLQLSHTLRPRGRPRTQS
jgi:putative transposase